MLSSFMLLIEIQKIISLKQLGLTFHNWSKVRHFDKLMNRTRIHPISEQIS